MFGRQPSRCALAHILVMFILCYTIFELLVNVCRVRFSFFSTKPEDWLERTSPKLLILWQEGRKDGVLICGVCCSMSLF